MIVVWNAGERWEHLSVAFSGVRVTRTSLRQHKGPASLMEKQPQRPFDHPAAAEPPSGATEAIVRCVLLDVM